MFGKETKEEKQTRKAQERVFRRRKSRRYRYRWVVSNEKGRGG